MNKLWHEYLTKELPTPFDIFFAGLACGAILGASVASIAISIFVK